MNYTGLKNVESHLRGLTRLIFLPLLFHPIKHYLCSFGYYHFTTLVLPRNLYLRKDRNYHNISYNIEKWNELSNFHRTSLMKIRIIYVEFFYILNTIERDTKLWFHYLGSIYNPISNNKQTIDLERNSSSEFYQKIFVNHRSVYNFWTNYSTRKVPRILSRLPLEQIDERFDNWRRETASTDVIGHRVKVS